MYALSQHDSKIKGRTPCLLLLFHLPQYLPEASTDNRNSQMLFEWVRREPSQWMGFTSRWSRFLLLILVIIWSMFSATIRHIAHYNCSSGHYFGTFQAAAKVIIFYAQSHSPQLQALVITLWDDIMWKCYESIQLSLRGLFKRKNGEPTMWSLL